MVNVNLPIYARNMDLMFVERNNIVEIQVMPVIVLDYLIFTLNIDKAMAQAIHDSEHKNVMPIVAHRKNNAKWLITMRADDWFKMYKKGGFSDGC